MLIKKRKSFGLNHCSDPKAFLEYCNDMNEIYEDINEYNPNRIWKILIVFDDMVLDMLINNYLLDSES